MFFRTLKNTINTLILSLYLFVVYVAYICVYSNANISTLFFLLIFVAVIIFFITSFIVNKAKNWEIKIRPQNNTAKQIVVYIIFTTVCFSVCMLWFLAYFPGGFSPDSLVQYAEAISGTYSDWHPAWHTLLFFTFPLSITGNVACIVFFQMVYFSLIIGYLGFVLYKYINLKYCISVILYILLNPFTGNILCFPWKDVAFAMAGLLSMIMITELYMSNGTWANKRWHLILLGVILANTTLFRHNGILFTGAAVVALLFNMEKKQWLWLFISFILMLTIIKGPIYHFMEVSQPGQRVLECMGLPLTVIANVAKENPEALDAETAKFVYSMATQEEWEAEYSCGNFNSIKWSIDTSVIDEVGALNILKMMMRCFINAPNESFKAAFSLTDIVFGIENGYESGIGVGIFENDYGIVYKGNARLVTIIENYWEFISKTIFDYFRTIGMSILVVLTAIFSKSNLASWKDWKRIFLCMPMLSYNFGTMLLLTGTDSRFFYISYLVCPLAVIILFLERKEVSK